MRKIQKNQRNVCVSFRFVSFTLSRDRRDQKGEGIVLVQRRTLGLLPVGEISIALRW